MSNFEKTLQQQRHIQQQQDQKDQQTTQSEPVTHSPSNPGSDYPTPPLPPQHQSKPGVESELEPAPQYKADAYKGSQKLEGKVALITGGDSGIGRAVAVLFAREGANVAIIYLCEDDDALETQKAIEAEGQSCLTLAGDIKDHEFCHQAVEQIVDHFGEINILVNNAAFQEHAPSLLDIDPARWDETFKTNIYGYFNMAQAVLPFLEAGDCIINTSSVTASAGSAELIDYSSTKGAINSFTYSLASNLAPKGIRVNAVAPGPVWTPLNPADRPAEDIKDFGKSTLFGRPAQPEELAPAYVFLASSVCSSYITGAVLPVTGQAGQ
ncbi:NAD(P)-dependent dehydrogenase (short-subunit alcohol dehydrogenase family) [Paenalcaligenes hominis]|uniref:NAD(P)-dependent dehydrogenase (Short-subunit alcohol dehydrogenase family) n=1 Tax=Paenalcaligenes hominis TaxID=643674 RepID=A0ABX0WTZ3_9BURK|nr:SDR family oxidoreductase [Paenalcaligenes hominis]NJB66203.1 NAD(P)-dependent dehydrogenase (short-subunit alcohol dehydrogenase family) [Paenalcaligenes hominis]GGE73121.1 short-chain dehydrogenase [Paenalcaligenes hominis]